MRGGEGQGRVEEGEEWRAGEGWVENRAVESST